MDASKAYSTTGVRPDSDFFLWKITRALRGSRRARRGAERRRRSPAGSRRRTRTSRRRRPSQYTSARRARKVIPQGLAVPRRLPVREAASLVRAPAGGPAARDGRAHPHRRRVPDDPQPHDLLVRDRRPGVHDRLRVRRAGRLHAPDADAARERGVDVHRARHADLRRPALEIRAALDRLDGAARASRPDGGARR